MSNDFFVGYLPAASETGRRAKGVAIGIVVAGGAVAALLAITTGPFDRAAFEYATVRDWQGTIEGSPVPALVVRRVENDSPFGALERFLLVAPWKHGASELVEGFAGAAVTLRGKRIVRGATTMIEIEPGSIARWAPVLPEDGSPLPASRVEDLGHVKMHGEIVDSKCFLGVMNPGRLEVHRACAIRCISGGIPPMLFARDERGREAHVLLVGADGRPVNERVLDLVARPVTVTGRLERRDGLDYLYLDAWIPSAGE